MYYYPGAIAHPGLYPDDVEEGIAHDQLPGEPPDTNPDADEPLISSLSPEAQALLDKLEALRPRPPLDRSIVLQTAATGPAYVVQNPGRRHIQIYLPAASTVTIGGAMPANDASLSQGWNVVDWLNGTTLQLKTGTTVNAILLFADDVAPGVK